MWGDPKHVRAKHHAGSFVVSGTELIDKEYIPILSVLAGGLLAVVGGFVANYLLQAASRRAEKRRLVREKLEEAYLLSFGVMDSLQNQMKRVVERDDNFAAVDCPIHRVSMLVKLYEPRLSNVVSDYSNNVEAFWSGAVNYWIESREAKSGLTMEKFSALLERPFRDVKLSHEKLLASIEDLVHKDL